MTTDQLLTEMASVLLMNGRWCARAQGCNQWGYGATAPAAMANALALRDGSPVDDSLDDLF